MVALGAAALIATTAALAGHGNGGPERQDASLRPVPHDLQADSGSNVRGKAKLLLRRGNRLQVNLKARGLSPNLPHAIHIHGKDAPEIATCPGANRRDDLVDDGLIETVEGTDDYGPVRVSFTTRGDTSTDSALALDRFPVAKGNGSLQYHRAFQIPTDVAQRLGDHHVVIHGEDLNGRRRLRWPHGGPRSAARGGAAGGVRGVVSEALIKPVNEEGPVPVAGLPHPCPAPPKDAASGTVASLP
ncbi:MAG: superoxide dismutase family protein [Actinobacteria bacterium]|nr:superoxide dismutase family protein [Actinomycetota bacterium]